MIKSNSQKIITEAATVGWGTSITQTHRHTDIHHTDTDTRNNTETHRHTGTQTDRHMGVRFGVLKARAACRERAHGASRHLNNAVPLYPSVVLICLEPVAEQPVHA